MVLAVKVLPACSNSEMFGLRNHVGILAKNESNKHCDVSRPKIRSRPLKAYVKGCNWVIYDSPIYFSEHPPCHTLIGVMHWHQAGRIILLQGCLIPFTEFAHNEPCALQTRRYRNHHLVVYRTRDTILYTVVVQCLDEGRDVQLSTLQPLHVAYWDLTSIIWPAVLQLLSTMIRRISGCQQIPNCWTKQILRSLSGVVSLTNREPYTSAFLRSSYLNAGVMWTLRVATSRGYPKTID